MPNPQSARRSIVLLAAAGLASPALAQLRIAAWNVSNYTGAGRENAFRTAIYAEYQGRRMAPDVLIGQEFLTPEAVAAFRGLLNSAAGSPGDWQAAPFIDGPDTDSALFYRESKVAYLGATIVVPGGDINGAPRHVIRYDLRPVGYTTPATILACYSVHMKAGSDADDQQRRLVEATAIRADADALPPGWNFLIAGDFNIQNSTQAAYQRLVGSLANNRGRFFDPINTPGDWNNNPDFRLVHTQAPGSTGAGMDDRFDFVLLSGSLSDQTDFDYIGNRNIPYSTGAWNDPAHSFRVWGNDGSTFNQSIALGGNTMVGPTIAQALRDATSVDNSGGHLPVFLDVRVPARMTTPETIDFGELTQAAAGQTASLIFTVENSADVSLWTTAGIAPLTYTISASGGATAPAGPFTAAPAVANAHIVSVPIDSPGPIAAALLITSSSSEHPARTITITGTVVAGDCYPNCDGSTAEPILNIADFSCFLQQFAAGDAYANCDHTTTEPALNVADFTCFLQSFAAGCP